MSDPIVVVASSESPKTPASPATPPGPVSDGIVEMVHDDALSLGYALSQITALQETATDHAARIAALEGIEEAQGKAIAAVVETVEEVAEAVEEMEPGNQLESVPDPEDTAPGKTHWFHRSGREWFGR